jgi:hypothetical protein
MVSEHQLTALKKMKKLLILLNSWGTERGTERGTKRETVRVTKWVVEN